MCYKEGDIKQDIKIEIYNCDPNYSEKGNCVLNYLEERLGQSVKNKKIPAKLMNRSYLNGYFTELKRILDSVNPNPTNMNDIKDEEDFLVDEIDWEAKEIDGITPYMLYLFCKQFNLSHICISAIGEIIGELRYVAKGNRPALIYMTNGYHLYPIKDHHEKRKIIERFKCKIKNDIDFEKDRDNPIINHLVYILHNEENKNLHNPYYLKGYFNELKRFRVPNNNDKYIELSLNKIEEEKYINNLKPIEISNFCKEFDINYECISEFGNTICKIDASSEDRPKLFLIYEDEMYFFLKKEDVENYQKYKNIFPFSSFRVLPKIWRHGQKEPENMLTKTEKIPRSFQSVDSNIKTKIRTCLNADKNNKMKTGNITFHDVKEMLKNQNNKCWLCQDEVILNNWLPNCCYQFSIDRIDDNLPHDKNNCRISCYFCNCRDGSLSLSPYKVCNAGCHRQIRFIRHRRDLLPEKFIRKINRDNKL